MSYRENPKEYMRKYYQQHKEVIKTRMREYHWDNREQRLAYNNKYRLENMDKIIKHRKEAKIWLNPMRKEYLNKYRKQKLRKTHFRIENIISCRLYKSIKFGCTDRKWKNVLGYGTEELKIHIEKQFKKGMSWNNYGKWQLDHIIPKRYFIYENFNDIGLRICWCLDNIRPEWSELNNKRKTL